MLNWIDVTDRNGERLSYCSCPFVCVFNPLVGSGRSFNTPFICKNIPLVENCKKVSGFSLIELVITLVVFSILAGFAVPGVQRFIESTRFSTAMNDLLLDINVARSEAMKRGNEIGVGGIRGQILVCVSSSGLDCTPGTWKSGWIVFWDQDRSGTFATASGDILLKSHGALPSTVTITANPAIQSVAFNQLGMPASGAKSEFQFTNTTLNTTRALCMVVTGLPSIREVCPP